MTPARTGLPALFLSALLAGCAFALTPAVHGKEVWMPVTAEERALTQCTLEPDAPAEALVHRIDINDEEFPRNRRFERYLRYKIYNPEKAEKLLRLSEAIYSYDGYQANEVELQARLHLPDGTVRTFGKEAVKEREVVRQGVGKSGLRRLFDAEGGMIKEKFLAVGAVPAGAILEYSVILKVEFSKPTSFHLLQLPAIPVRKFHYRQVCPLKERRGVHQLFGLNTTSLKVEESPAGDTITVTAEDLPSLAEEPLSGPQADYAVMLVDTYTAKGFASLKRRGLNEKVTFSREEPWAPIATFEYWRAADHVELTKLVRRTAAEVTAGAASDLEKARRLHDHVQRLHQQFISKSFEADEWGWRNVVGMDSVLNFAKERPQGLQTRDFFWLALSLYRAAGLNAEMVLLPDRGNATLTPQLVSAVFVPERAVALRIGETWHYSMPVQQTLLAFDELPWQQRGLGGLLALEKQQVFIPVPHAAAAESQVQRRGDFQLDAAGTLTGKGTLAYTGHEARWLRQRLRKQTRDEQLLRLRRDLTEDLAGAQVEVTDLRHVEDPYRPIEFDFTLTWPGFGIVTEDHLIVQPQVFRHETSSPFAASTRRNRVIFSFSYQNRDEVSLTLPPGYRCESLDQPASYPGPLLAYQAKLELDAPRGVLRVTREFSSGLISVAAKDYAQLKRWYDAVALSDQHSLLLVQTEDPAPAAPAPAVLP